MLAADRLLATGITPEQQVVVASLCKKRTPVLGTIDDESKNVVLSVVLILVFTVVMSHSSASLHARHCVLRSMQCGSPLMTTLHLPKIFGQSAATRTQRANQDAHKMSVLEAKKLTAAVCSSTVVHVTWLMILFDI